jgi:hypothetical protein
MPLSDTQRTIMSTTRGDLHRLTQTGVALLRGRASLAELNAMAAMAKPGKTKYLSADLRGVLAFQSTLDRFAGLVKAADDDRILEVTNHSIPDAVNPADACVQATAFDSVTKGKTALIKDHGLLMFARGIFIQLKAKYGDRLQAERTLTLEGRVKKAELSRVEKAKMAYSRLSDAERAELIASVTSAPAQADEPEVQVLKAHAAGAAA